MIRLRPMETLLPSISCELRQQSACRYDASDPVIVGIGDPDEPSGPIATPWGRSSLALVGRSAVAIGPRPTGSGYGSDLLAGGVNEADRVVLRVYNPDVAGWVNGEFLGPVKRSGAGRSAVAGIAFRGRSRDGRDCASVRADDPERIPFALEDIHRTVGSDIDGAGTPDGRVLPPDRRRRRGGPFRCRRMSRSVRWRDPRAGCGGPATSAIKSHCPSRANATPLGSTRPASVAGAAVTRIDLGAVPGHRGDHPGAAVDSPHAAIESIGKVHVARLIDHDSIGFVELGHDGRTAVAGKARLADAGDVAILPVALSIRRIRWLNVSVRYTLPCRSNARSNGWLSWAAIAGPPSPRSPAIPGPRRGRDHRLGPVTASRTAQIVHDAIVAPSSLQESSRFKA